MLFLHRCTDLVRTVITVAHRAHRWIRLLISFSSGCEHSTFQHYESYLVVMKLSDQYLLDFSVFYKVRMWYL